MEENYSRTKPFFSIIIPCWNNEDTLERTLHSIFEQSYTNYEIILVVRDKKPNFDYSFDVTHVLEQTDCGVSNARNLGLKYAKGTHVCFLDADDTWSCTHLETLDKVLWKYPHLDWIIHNFYWVTKKSCHVKNPSIVASIYNYFDLFGVFNKCFHVLSSTCFRNVWREDYSAHPIYFNPNMPLGEDIEFITKFALRYPLCYYDSRPTVNYNAPEKPYKKYTRDEVNIPALDDLLEQSDSAALNYLDVWSLSTCLQNLDRGHNTRAYFCLDFVSDKYKLKRRVLRMLCLMPYPIGLWAHQIYNRFFWR